ncbi:Pycsar system effector family protein [Streptomyces sp. NPDC048270]|uniref:Pycsar system effector family protein n=1 Tax=Streptomyces sp. NPDC048270 TaxID=3154615 RepID=UPI0033FC7ECB
MDVEAMTAQDPRDTARRIHEALGEWTARVDTKGASFARAVESAAVAGIVALSDKGHIFDNLTGLRVLAPLWAGIFLVMAGALCTITVVAPRLRSRKQLQAEAPDHFTYFGHLQFWDPTALAQKLDQQDMLPILSNRLINMSKIAWKSTATSSSPSSSPASAAPSSSSPDTWRDAPPLRP